MTINIPSEQKTHRVHIRNKLNININKEGTVRRVNGKVYVDFMYLGYRVRESAGIPWNNQNAKEVRGQLDRIMLAINDGSFEFRKVFPKSRKSNFFSDLERKLLGRQKQPGDVKVGKYALQWYERLKATGRVTERTLLGYKSHLDLYIIPFFGNLAFSEISPAMLDEFAIWAKGLRLKKKEVSNKTINKCLVPFKLICKHAGTEHRWGSDFNPFFGYKNLPENNTDYQIQPFSIDEQQRIITALPRHWKPYFQFAFCSGLRQGEQFAVKPGDIDSSKGCLAISRAMTLGLDGQRIEGKTKNRFSRREIQLLPAMKSVLETQLAICKQLKAEYLFCTENGCRINHANLSTRVWQPTLIAAGISYRPMVQTRHSFATTALSLGENPLWIAHVMGHRDTDMIVRVYAKFVKNAVNNRDGGELSNLHSTMISNCG